MIIILIMHFIHRRLSKHSGILYKMHVNTEVEANILKVALMLSAAALRLAGLDVS